MQPGVEETNCMTENKKAKIISMRLTQRQYDFLDELAKRIRQQTGANVTRSSIIMKLMEYGLPHLEKDFPRGEKTAHEDEEFKEGAW